MRVILTISSSNLSLFSPFKRKTVKVRVVINMTDNENKMYSISVGDPKLVKQVQFTN